MQCARCAGMRIPEFISDGGIRVVALRCIHCGDLVDRVILRNRRRRQLPEPGRARTPIFSTSRRKQDQPALA